MSGSGNPSIEEIMAALQRSGYLMEQEVASQLERLGFHVRTNVAFTDSEEGKSQETDVRAYKEIVRNNDAQILASIEFIVECKLSTNPYAFIARAKNRVDFLTDIHEYRYPVHEYQSHGVKLPSGGTPVRMIRPFFHLKLDEVHYDHRSPLKAVQFCRIDRNGKDWQANHSGLYDSIFYPMAKAVTVRLNEIGKQHGPKKPNDWRFFRLIVPLVVVNSPIYLIDSMAETLVPEERGYVHFKRELKSKSLEGLFSVDFVRQSYLEQFVSDLKPMIDRIADLTLNRADFVFQLEIPWNDEQ